MIQRLGHLVDQVVSVEDDGPRPFVALENLVSWTGGFRPDTELPVLAPGPTGMASFEAGDVLFGKLRPYLAKSWRADRRGICSTELIVMRPRPALDSRWLAYLAMSHRLIEWAVATSEGVKMPRTSWEKLRLLDVDAPDPHAQRAIADYLDAETMRGDTLVQLSRRQQVLNGERLRTRIVTEMGRLAAVRGTVPLRRLVTCLDGRRVPLNAEERSTRQGDFPYYGASGVVDHVDHYLFDETLVLLGEDGAQLGDPQYPIAQLVMGKVWVNNHAHVLRPHADPAFLEESTRVANLKAERPEPAARHAAASVARLASTRSDRGRIAGAGP